MQINRRVPTRYEPPAKINFTLSNVTFHLLIMHSGHKLSHVRSKFMVDTRIFRCFEGREFFFHLLFFSHVLCDSLSLNVCIYVCKYTCMEAYVHHACMDHHVSVYVCVCLCIRKYNSSDLNKSYFLFLVFFSLSHPDKCLSVKFLLSFLPCFQFMFH